MDIWLISSYTHKHICIFYVFLCIWKLRMLMSWLFCVYEVKLKVLVIQSCPTLWDPVDCSPPGSSIHGILQVRILEWVAIPFSRGPSRPRDQTWVSHIAGRLFTLWASQMVLVVKNLPPDAGDIRDAGSIPGLGRSPGEGHGSPLQYLFLPGESHGHVQFIGSQRVGHNWSDFSLTHTHTHTHIYF